MILKLCKVCLEEKELTLFHKSHNNKYGVNHLCKPCRAKQQAEKYKQNWFRFQVTLKRAECKKKNIQFNLNEDYLKLIWTNTCPVFKVSFDLSGKRGSYSPTLDRINPRAGYVKGNVAYISFRANRIKYDASIQELKDLVDWYEGATTRA